MSLRLSRQRYRKVSFDLYFAHYRKQTSNVELAIEAKEPSSSSKLSPLTKKPKLEPTPDPGQNSVSSPSRKSGHSTVVLMSERKSMWPDKQEEPPQKTPILFPKATKSSTARPPITSSLNSSPIATRTDPNADVEIIVPTKKKPPETPVMDVKAKLNLKNANPAQAKPESPLRSESEKRVSKSPRKSTQVVAPLKKHKEQESQNDVDGDEKSVYELEGMDFKGQPVEVYLSPQKLRRLSNTSDIMIIESSKTVTQSPVKDKPTNSSVRFEPGKISRKTFDVASPVNNQKNPELQTEIFEQPEYAIEGMDFQGKSIEVYVSPEKLRRLSHNSDIKVIESPKNAGESPLRVKSDLETRRTNDLEQSPVRKRSIDSPKKVTWSDQVGTDTSDKMDIDSPQKRASEFKSPLSQLNASSKSSISSQIQRTNIKILSTPDLSKEKERKPIKELKVKDEDGRMVVIDSDEESDDDWMLPAASKKPAAV